MRFLDVLHCVHSTKLGGVFEGPEDCATIQRGLS